MKYLFGLLYAGLIGFMSGWFFYKACMGFKKDRIMAGIIWGVCVAIISALATFGD